MSVRIIVINDAKYNLIFHLSVGGLNYHKQTLMYTSSNKLTMNLIQLHCDLFSLNEMTSSVIFVIVIFVFTVKSRFISGTSSQSIFIATIVVML